METKDTDADINIPGIDFTIPPETICGARF